MAAARLIRAVAALAAAACLLALVPATSEARAPRLIGAATHPLWDDSDVGTFDRELDHLVAAGANVVRIDIGWSTLQETGPSSVNAGYVQRADTFFEHARQRGLEVIVTLWTTPCWASSAPPDVKQGCAGAWWERGVAVYPPSDSADFARAAAFVAERWGDDMAALEIWNEPNFAQFFRTPEPARDYVDMLAAAYPAVKQVAPDLPVIGPAMLMSHVLFLEAFYREGGGAYVDAISSRPFNQGRSPYDQTVPPPPLGTTYSFLLGVPQVRETMIANGHAHEKMWFTELGWSSCAPAPGNSEWCIGADNQARYIGDALRIIRDRWDFVEAVSVYNLRNKGDNLDDRESQMGMLHRNFAPKPAWPAFAAAIADLAANPGGASEPVPDPGGAGAGAAAGQLSQSGLGPNPFGSAATPAPDTVAPRLRGLTLRPRTLRVARGRGGGSTVVFRLSEAARVTLAVDRVVRRATGGRAVQRAVTATVTLSGGAVRRPAGRRALRRAVRGTITLSGRHGANRFDFDGRIGRRLLPPGRYRLLATARDAAGNRSARMSAPFRVERG